MSKEFNNPNRISFYLLAAAVLLAACQSQPASQQPQTTQQKSEAPKPATDQVVAVIETDKGKMVMEFMTREAPDAAENFRKLAEDGFYDRTAFHRVKAGQFIQGGDPLSRDNYPYNDGQGSSGKFLKAEFSDHKFSRGTVAMSRLPDDPNSSSCQFFIVLQRIPQMDKQYTAFGRIIEGIEVADKISKLRTSASDPRLKDRPASPPKISSIMIVSREEAGAAKPPPA